MKRLLFITTLFIYGALLAVAQPTVVKTEMRAVWLTVIGGIDWPRIEASNTANMQRQQQELCSSASTSATSAAWNVMLG